MKKNFGAKAVITPLPVLIIATYNQDGTPNAMNAAWGGQCGRTHIALNLGEHATTENIRRNQAFTVSFADKKNLVASDYVGLVSAKNDKDKMKKSGLHTEKSEFVNAPVITDYPLTLECKVVSIREEILDDNGTIDIGKIEALVYDSPSHSYRVVGDVVGSAFSAGKALK